MTLKDWKKTVTVKENNKIFRIIYNDYNHGNDIILERVSNKQYKGSFRIGNTIKFTKLFKSKSQALKFSKKYMRTH